MSGDCRWSLYSVIQVRLRMVTEFSWFIVPMLCYIYIGWYALRAPIKTSHLNLMLCKKIIYVN